jgi:hypothetical protein
MGVPPRWSPQSTKVGTKFGRQVAVAQSAYFAYGLRATEFVLFCVSSHKEKHNLIQFSSVQFSSVHFSSVQFSCVQFIYSSLVTNVWRCLFSWIQIFWAPSCLRLSSVLVYSLMCSPHNFAAINSVYLHVPRGSVVVWGTTLPIGRSRVRFLMRALILSINLTLPVWLRPWVDSSSNRNECQESSMG